MTTPSRMKDQTSSRRLRYLIPFLIIAFGAFLRVEAIHDTRVIAPLRSDAGQYMTYALNLVYHHTYSKQPYHPHSHPKPDAVRPPGYPFLLAAILSFSPRLPLVFIQYVQALLGAATVLLAFLLFRRFLDPIPAYISTFLVAISPHLIVSGIYILTEGLFTFGLLASLLLCAYAYERDGKSWAFLAGATLGAVSLIRAGFQYFVLALWPILRLQGKSRGFALLLLCGFLVIFGAWTARNIHSIGRVADNTLMIRFLHHGMYPDFEYAGRPDTYPFPYRYNPDSASINRSVSSVLSAIVKRFREQPIRYLRWYLVGKSIAFWQWNIVQGMGDVYVYPVRKSPYFFRPLFRWTHALSRFLHAPLVVLGLLGCVLCWFPPAASTIRPAIFSVRLTASLIIYYQVIHIIGSPFPRYSEPLLPLIYGMAMYCLCRSYVWLRERPRAT